MHNFAMVCFGLGVALGVFGVWGTLSETGREKFPGGGQSLPFYALIAALVLVAAARIMAIFVSRSRRQSADESEDDVDKPV